MKCNRCRVECSENRCGRCKEYDRNRNTRANEAIEKWLSSYEGALEFAVGAEIPAVTELLKHGSVLAAAEALGMTPAALRRVLGEMRRRAARRGYSPEHDMTRSVPAGFGLRGVSTLYTRDHETGEQRVSSQWVKSKTDEEHKYTILLDAIQHTLDGYECRMPTISAPTTGHSDLLAVYPMGDPHFGLYAWAEECGDGFDLKTAERNLFTAVDHLVTIAPPAKTAAIINLGDFFHADNKESRTARSGHVLDVDTRWAKVLRVGLDTMIRCVERALEKHEKVIVINEIGNHDDHSAIMLSLAMSKFFANNPRVEIDQSPAPFHYVEFGQCLIGVHHGHGPKRDRLGEIMAADKPAEWGRTKYRHWYTGHIHHDTVKDLVGCTVESFRTLAARDAWHHASGYRSNRDMKCDIWHRQHGRVSRNIVGINQVWEAVA